VSGLCPLLVPLSLSPDTFKVWKEGRRRGKQSVVHRHLGAKDRKMVYSAQGGTTTESVTVQASRRRALSLTRDEVLDLGRMGLAIEDHYGQAMDIEWAKDGRTGDLFIVQARPETVHVHGKKNSLERYVLDPQASALKTSGGVLATGQAVGTRVGSGRVRLYH